MMGDVMVITVAFIGLIYGMNGFDGFARRYNRVRNQPWRKKKDHS